MALRVQLRGERAAPETGLKGRPFPCLLECCSELAINVECCAQTIVAYPPLKKGGGEMFRHNNICQSEAYQNIVNWYGVHMSESYSHQEIPIHPPTDRL